jgi:hypothetical protein
LDAIELVNRGAKQNGLGGGLQGTADNILNGINWIRSQTK